MSKKKNPGEKREKFEIIKILVLSTGHITSRDDDIVGKLYWVKNLDYAYEVSMNDQAELDELVELATEAGLSAAFVQLLHLTRKLGCSALRLDADGLLMKSLPKFDW